jgi:aminopeptidase N
MRNFSSGSTVVLIGLLISLLGCSPQGQKLRAKSPLPAPQNAHKHTEYVRDAALLNPALEEVNTNIWVNRYDLKATFDWTLRRLYATNEITFKVLSPAKKEIFLNSSSLTIKSVGLKAGSALPYKLDSEKHLLRIDLSSLDESALAKEQKLLISYETNPSKLRGLRIIPNRVGDPLQVPVLYTVSEPRGASFWMPCNDRPSNRAQISVEFTMDASETLISNGDLLVNEVKDGIRRMKYSTRYTLPTYLMAFAAGEFQSATRYHGGLPVSVWARKGATVDWDGMLSSVIRQISTFERLLVPYPFEKYTVVLLPEFPGGIEHAGITFQSEDYGGDAKNAGGLNLTAHELAHQWFGDLVTVKTWDDIWIKEGMATLLAEESSRPYIDEKNTGSLFGSRFSIVDGEPVVNPSAPPEEKYNSGPYGRSAWVLTQVRSIVGEKIFWGTLAKVMRDHAFGNISTEEFLQAWTPSLGEEGVKRLKTALFAKALPELKWAGTKEEATLELLDSESALLTPIELRVYGPGTSFSSTTLAPGKTEPLLEIDKRFFVVDPQEKHPYFLFFKDKEKSSELILGTIPKTGEDLKVFLSLGSRSQETALNAKRTWKLTSMEFPAFKEALGSEKGKVLALSQACKAAGQVSAEKTEEISAWKKIIQQAFLRPYYLGLDSSVDLTDCQPFLQSEFLSQRWAQIESLPSSPGLSYMDLQLLSGFSAPSSAALSIWGKLGTDGPNVQTKMLGIGQLIKHLTGVGNFSKPSQEELPQWKAYFRNILVNTEVLPLQFTAITATAVTKDIEILPLLASTIKKGTMLPQMQKVGICAAHAAAKENPEAWKAFVQALGELTQYSGAVQTVIKTPETCTKS